MNRNPVRQKKTTVRDEYRQQENQRTQQSASLSQRFQDLKSLTVEFGYFSPEGVSRNRQIKYTVNPDRAKSVFRLQCMNDECACGDFDLSEALTQAVAERQITATGELRCPGWIDRGAAQRTRCCSILRYKFKLEYGVRTRAGEVVVQSV